MLKCSAEKFGLVNPALWHQQGLFKCPAKRHVQSKSGGSLRERLRQNVLLAGAESSVVSKQMTLTRACNEHALGSNPESDF